MKDATLTELFEGRRRFLELVAAIRPDLHRYCARMTGSIAEGEDVVQETLARAYYALADLETMPPLRPWLFRIAHARAIDYLRRYDVRMGRPLDDAVETSVDVAPDPEDALAREQALRAALSRFLQLPSSQRSCVILKDVLGHSADEIGDLLGLTVPAVKSALHRGRTQLELLAKAENELDALAKPPKVRAPSDALKRYAALFNARDWDGVRAMLADDVKLDLLDKSNRSGKREVAGYFTNYDALDGWRFVPALLEGREVLVVHREPGDGPPGYFVELTFCEGKISLIRDFRYVLYILADAGIELVGVDVAREWSSLLPASKE